MLYYADNNLQKKEMRAAIARRLHHERLSAGLTLEGLAEKMFNTKPTVQKWEKGWETGSGENTIPTMDQLLKLCELYRCSPGYLLCEYDEKTKQHTDIGVETGLLPDNITRLQRMMSAIMNGEEYESKTNCCFLAFLNLVISNADKFNEMLIERIGLTERQMEFDNDPDKKVLLNAVEIVNSKNPDADLFGSHSPSLSGDCLKAMQDYFFGIEADKNRVATLMGKFHKYYWDVLSTYRTRQSDFVLSDTFLDIAKDFFRMYPELASGNSEFAKYMKKLRKIIKASSKEGL